MCYLTPIFGVWTLTMLQSLSSSGLYSLHAAEQHDTAITSLADALADTSDYTARDLSTAPTRWNTMIPAIAHLPDDILADTFVLVAHECRDKYVVGWRRFSWILVSHVCRHWRAVALDHSVLWAGQIHLQGNQDRHRAFLTRAKTAPLSVYILAFHPDVNDQDFCRPLFGSTKADLGPIVVKTMEPHAYRIRSLTIDISGGLLSTLSNSPSLDAPILEILNVRCGYDIIATNEKFWFLSDAPLGSLTKLRL